MTGQEDLVVLVADADAELTLKTLLEERAFDLGIRPVCYRIIREPMHDAGVFQNAHNILRLYIHQASYALTILDREGSGREKKWSADQIEEDVEKRLRGNGWTDAEGQSRAAAIVLDPELEVWVWSRSPHVAEVLGLTGDELQQILNSCELAENGKPKHPKETMLTALRLSRRPMSASIFQELARRVSLQSQERAFDKLRKTLQKWFPV